MLAARLLGIMLRDSAIMLIDPQGTEHHCGPKHIVPAIALRVHTREAARRLLLRPQLAFGEGFVRGEITFQKGSLRDFMRLVASQRQRWLQTASPLGRQFANLCAAVGNYLHQFNTRARARRNVHRHYDIGNRIFELFLDPAMQYTCAFFPPDVLPAGRQGVLDRYFQSGPRDLDLAQQRRIAHMIRKLGVTSGMRVLDVGCGWGGFALEIARQADVEVLGISLSRQQLDYAREQTHRAGLASRVRFELIDYRDVRGRFDRIVAAGVLEHVGKRHFAAFFRQLEKRLAPEGVILVDSTCRADGPGGTNPWLRKYIYPGGYIPSLSEIQLAIEGSGLELLDLEIFRLHYALTVREWERRFTASADEIAQLMGHEFVRMWQLYLTASEMSFVYGRYVNIQLQLSNSRFSMPITRDYMTGTEIKVAPRTPERV